MDNINNESDPLLAANDHANNDKNNNTNGNGQHNGRPLPPIIEEEYPFSHHAYNPLGHDNDSKDYLCCLWCIGTFIISFL
jgi:hypothetical protein